MPLFMYNTRMHASEPLLFQRNFSCSYYCNWYLWIMSGVSSKNNATYQKPYSPWKHAIDQGWNIQWDRHVICLWYYFRYILHIFCYNNCICYSRIYIKLIPEWVLIQKWVKKTCKHLIFSSHIKVFYIFRSTLPTPEVIFTVNFILIWFPISSLKLNCIL